MTESIFHLFPLLPPELQRHIWAQASLTGLTASAYGLYIEHSPCGPYHNPPLPGNYRTYPATPPWERDPIPPTHLDVGGWRENAVIYGPVLPVNTILLGNTPDSDRDAAGEDKRVLVMPCMGLHELLQATSTSRRAALEALRDFVNATQDTLCQHSYQYAHDPAWNAAARARYVDIRDSGSKAEGKMILRIIGQLLQEMASHDQATVH